MSKEATPKKDEIVDETVDLVEEQSQPKAATDAAEKPADDSETGKTVLQSLKDLTSDEDNTISERTRISLPFILGGDFFGRPWFRRQLPYIVMVVAMVVVYISLRYSCQQAMIETKTLNDTLIDRRYKALTRSSQLKEKTRRSYIEESLVDTTLQTAVTPSFNLTIDE